MLANRLASLMHEVVARVDDGVGDKSGEFLAPEVMSPVDLQTNQVFSEQRPLALPDERDPVTASQAGQHTIAQMEDQPDLDSVISLSAHLPQRQLPPVSVPNIPMVHLDLVAVDPFVQGNPQSTAELTPISVKASIGTDGQAVTSVAAPSGLIGASQHAVPELQAQDFLRAVRWCWTLVLT